MEYLQAAFPEIAEILKNNPFVAGAVSVWALSVLTWLSRNLPQSFYEFVKYNVITTITVENDDFGFDTARNILALKRFLENNTSRSFVRNYELAFYSIRHYVFGVGSKINTKGSVTSLSPGAGRHIFFYNGRLFWANVGKEKREQKNDREKITIGTFTRNVSVFDSLIEAIAPNHSDDNIDFFNINSGGWRRIASVRHRDPNTLVYHGDLLNRIIKEVDEFYAKEKWHIERGIKHKLVIMLHGMPGTGKTSLIHAVASHFKKSIRQVNFDNATDNGLIEAMGELDSDDIAVFEDVDSCSVLHARHLGKSVKLISGDTRHGKMKEIRGSEETIDTVQGSSPLKLDSGLLTLSGVLNVFDGVLPLHGLVVFMNTNRLEVLDNALLRKRRTDRIYEVLPLEDEDVRKYLKIHFGDYEFGPEPFGSIAGCNLSGIVEDFYENPADVEIALREFIQLGEVKK